MNVYMQDRNVLLTPQPIYFAWEHDKSREPLPEELEFFYTSKWYKDYARTMAKWMANGVWSRNVMNNNIPVREAFVQGKSASMLWGASLFSIGTTMEANGVGKAAWYDISPEVVVRRRGYDMNMWAIASTSENIERSALVIDLMKTRKELIYLLKGGIEGRHYVAQPNNTFIPGTEASKYPYGHWTGALSFPEDMRTAYLPTTPEMQINITENLDSRVQDIDIDGFRINVEPIAAEWAVMTALIEEYRSSFECGVFGDQTEAKLTEFENRLKTAGVDKLVANVRNDYATYVKNFNTRKQQ
jgi:hypothetical protein